jgi:predicted glycosyltransferase
MMRLLFDLGHPAHIHLFRNLIKRTRDEGGEVLAATREKDVTVSLCQAYHIPQVVLSRANPSHLLTGGWELLNRTLKLLWVALRFKPNALLGTSLSIGIVGRLIGRPSFVFNEDDTDVNPLLAQIAYPTCTYIVTPECLKHENHGQKQLTYPGYHELAYLHPDHFTPDSTVLNSVGLDLNEPYFILRFVALKAQHDTNASGLSVGVAQELVEMLIAQGRVLITAEEELRSEFKAYQFPLPPDKLLDVLAFASMYIGDSQTVTAEAAVLGVPGLRCNTFARHITYLNELEQDYGLTKGFLPDESDDLLATTQEWLSDLDNVKRGMLRKRGKMLKKCVNLADWQWQMLCEKLSL